MRLVCLECSAAYEAPDNLFGPQPREVRCNRCGYQWTVVGSPATNGSPGGLSIGPAEAPALPPSPSPDLPRPRPTMAPALRAEPLAVPAPPPPAPPARTSARPAETLAESPAPPREPLTAKEIPRPAPLLEPSAESTRTLLSSLATDEPEIVPPDPEERRLSHDLDFGGAERQRRTSGSGDGTRRVAIILILLIVAAGIAAVVLKTQIIGAVPSLKSTYEAIGL